MLFNSLDYLIFFLPIVFLIYCICKKISVPLSKWIIIAASIYFYNYITEKYFSILIASCAINYLCYIAINKNYKAKAALITGIILNAASLCYFKYISFGLSILGIDKLSWAASLGLPLAISFFTFQQISFLVDKYQNKIVEVNITDYLYYITFFPKLIAGPITRYSDLMPQSYSKSNVKSSELISGLVIISVGLFKKIIISSYFSGFADSGYSNTPDLTFFGAWGTSLSYTAQIYFDFSGYSDIAIGSALLLGIKLPINFNSPYKSTSINDFWDRWHISLSTWLRDYIYIPLGGSRCSIPRTYTNIMATFIVSGIWHGVGFNFILWGVMHGIATSVNRYWSSMNYRMNKFIAWFITFQFINLTWIPFRAATFSDAYNVVIAMFNPVASEIKNPLNDFIHSVKLISTTQPIDLSYILNSSPLILSMLIMCLGSCFCMKNSNEIGGYTKKSFVTIQNRWVILSGIILTASIIGLFGGVTKAQFIYAAF